MAKECGEGCWETKVPVAHRARAAECDALLTRTGSFSVMAPKAEAIICGVTTSKHLQSCQIQRLAVELGIGTRYIEAHTAGWKDKYVISLARRKAGGLTRFDIIHS